MGSRRRRVRWCRAFEEEYVISSVAFPISPAASFYGCSSGYPPQLTKFLIFLALTPASPLEPSGSWDSIHVFETMERGRQAHYKLTSTIMLQLITRRVSAENSSHQSVTWTHDGEINLSGSMTRQVCFTVCLVREAVTNAVYRWSKITLCRMQHHTCRTLGGWSKIWKLRCVTCCRRFTSVRRVM